MEAEAAETREKNAANTIQCLFDSGATLHRETVRDLNHLQQSLAYLPEQPALRIWQ